MTRYPTLTSEETFALGADFRFETSSINQATTPVAPKLVRKVHPSLDRISAWISSVGAAVSLGDVDKDGFSDDAVVIDPRTDTVSVSQVPDNRAGRTPYPPFILDPKEMVNTDTMAPMGSLIGDFNEDGQADVLVYYWGRSPIIFLRSPAISMGNGNAAFHAVPMTENDQRWFTNGAIQADLDGDGHVDLLFGNYFQDGAKILDFTDTTEQSMHDGKAKALNGGRKHLFLWHRQEDATKSLPFREVPSPFDIDIDHGWTLAIGCADINEDQLPDLYFGHDFGPDRLLINASTPGHLAFISLKGEANFTTPKSCVLGNDSFKGMGCEFKDINRDGKFDIAVSNIATSFGLTESHFVWINRADDSLISRGIAPYRNQSEQLGMSRSGWGWDFRFGDFDNNGFLEGIQAVGFIKGQINRWPELQAIASANSLLVKHPDLWPKFKPGADLSGHDKTPFFVRSASGRYFDTGEQPNLGVPRDVIGRGISLSDTDGDGMLDIAMACQWSPALFLHNQSRNQGQFLGLRLLLPIEPGMQKSEPIREEIGHRTVPSIPCRPAFGATVLVHLPNGGAMIGQVDGGSGHSGKSSPEIHFGLGAQFESDTNFEVDLRWRDSGGPKSEKVSVRPGWNTVILGYDLTDKKL